MTNAKTAWELLGVEKHQLPLLLPSSYRDFSKVVTDFHTLPQLVGQQVVVKGWCVHQGWAPGSKPRYSVQLFDECGLSLSLSLFCTAEDAEALPDNAEAAFFGEVVADYLGRCHINKVLCAPLSQIGKVVPVYPALKGKLSREGVFSLITTHLDACIPDCLAWLRASTADIPTGSMRTAIACRTWTFDRLITSAHWPSTIRQGEACIDVMDRMAAYIEAYRLQNAEQVAKPAVMPLPNAGFAGVPELCPFPLTGEQISVAQSILTACNKSEPSHNLLLGDVGSGKSYVISLVVAAVVRGKGRVAVMLPSRILVNQMYELFASLFPELCPKLLDDDVDGDADNHDSPLWVGTTGLLHRKWSHRWDLVVVDEQQRFSVGQRQSLVTNHLIEATATPICRTMALARWGSNIDIFRLTQSPVKRVIESRVFKVEDRGALMSRVMDTLANGGQVMVICPKKDESKPAKKKHATDASDEQASVARVVSDFERILPRMSQTLGFTPRIVYATGARTEEENEQSLQAMKNKEAHLLVATTVVETGVNIPALTHVIIYHADRLGAVQLHQLRGRLVRAGGYGLFDLYLPTPPSATTIKRMEIITSHTQGYDVAMADLRLRGCGDILRGASQAGAGQSILPRRPVNVDAVEQFIGTLGTS